MSNAACVDSIHSIIKQAEENLISTTPGAVPPFYDDGGHLPFGGTIGNTRGPSAFGKRKMTRANAIGNPQALLLNFPPTTGPAQIACWERNYKSSIYQDPSAEAERLKTTNQTHGLQGFPTQRSDLALSQQTCGNLRQTACTRPTPSPSFHPPWRNVTDERVRAADYTWKWPQREKREPPPQIRKYAAALLCLCNRVRLSFYLAIPPLTTTCDDLCPLMVQAGQDRATIHRRIRIAPTMAKILS